MLMVKKFFLSFIDSLVVLYNYVYHCYMIFPVYCDAMAGDYTDQNGGWYPIFGA